MLPLEERKRKRRKGKRKRLEDAGDRQEGCKAKAEDELKKARRRNLPVSTGKSRSAVLDRKIFTKLLDFLKTSSQDSQCVLRRSLLRSSKLPMRSLN